MAAAGAGHREVVVFLLEKGARPQTRAQDGQRAVDYAVEAGHHEIAELLAAVETAENLRRQMTRQAQRQLAELGYDPGPADGSPGPRTRDAIRNFEAERELPITGEVSPRLLRELEDALSSRTPPPLPPAEEVAPPPAVSEAAPEEPAVPGASTDPDGGADPEASARAACRDREEGDRGDSFWDDIGEVLGDGVETVLDRFDSLERRDDFITYCKKFPEAWIWDNGTCKLVHCQQWLHAEGE